IQHGFKVSYQVMPKYFDPPMKIIDVPENCDEGVEKELESSFKLFFNDLDACANKIRRTLEVLMDSLSAPREEERRPSRYKEQLGQYYREMLDSEDFDEETRKSHEKNYRCIRNAESLLEEKGYTFKSQSEEITLTLEKRLERYFRSISADSESDRIKMSEVCNHLLKFVRKTGNYGSHYEEEALSREKVLDAYQDLEIALSMIYTKLNSNNMGNSPVREADVTST
ncbi:MAG: hypothetical protein AAF740_12985, partial [Bacteroidota bacterium]